MLNFAWWVLLLCFASGTCKTAKEVIGCKGEEEILISEVLEDVNLNNLAKVLPDCKIHYNGIHTGCKQGDNQEVDSCCRRELVQKFISSQSLEPCRKTAEKIANSLQKLGYERAATTLRLDFGVIESQATRDTPVTEPPPPPPAADPTPSPIIQSQAPRDTQVTEPPPPPADPTSSPPIIRGDKDETGTCSRDDPDCDKPSDKKPRFVEDDWQEQEMKFNELEFFEYRDSDGKMKIFRLLQQIQGRWRSIGMQLEIETAVLNGFEKKHRGEVLDMLLEVFQYWSGEGLDKYPYTWGSVVKMLEVVQLKNIGKKLEKALSNRV